MADPILLIELLSPGNAKDTRDNVWAYTTISSVREIVIVHTARQVCPVEGFRTRSPDLVEVFRSLTRGTGVTPAGPAS